MTFPIGRDALADGEAISSAVMLNAFQHPLCLQELAERADEWTLKQVQGDKLGVSDV